MDQLTLPCVYLDDPSMSMFVWFAKGIYFDLVFFKIPVLKFSYVDFVIVLYLDINFDFERF